MIFNINIDYNEVVTQEMTLNRVEITNDIRIVYKIIIKNFHKDSDVYTCIKSLTRYRSGLYNIIAYLAQYDSYSIYKMIINKKK